MSEWFRRWPSVVMAVAGATIGAGVAQRLGAASTSMTVPFVAMAALSGCLLAEVVGSTK